MWPSALLLTRASASVKGGAGQTADTFISGIFQPPCSAGAASRLVRGVEVGQVMACYDMTGHDKLAKVHPHEGAAVNFSPKP